MYVKLRKSLIIFMITVIVFLSSCQIGTPKNVVKTNSDDSTSVFYNGVEYIEHVYDFRDSFRPFLCFYSLTEYENSLFKKDVYSIDESFVADKRDENLNYIYVPLLLWEPVIYERKDFVVPELKDIHDEIDNILIVYPDIKGDNKSEKQVIDDPDEISVILDFFESLESAEVKKSGGIPADNKEIHICAVSGFYGGEFDVGPEFVYYSNDELLVYTDGKLYKAPEAVNEILQNNKRTKYEKDLRI